MIGQIAKLSAEAGVHVSYSGSGGAAAQPFRRLVELARHHSGHPDPGCVDSWLHHVCTRDFCAGWNEYGAAVRAARAKAIE
jgi:hypothetical protein